MYISFGEFTLDSDFVFILLCVIICVMIVIGMYIVIVRILFFSCVITSERLSPRLVGGTSHPFLSRERGMSRGRDEINPFMARPLDRLSRVRRKPIVGRSLVN